MKCFRLFLLLAALLSPWDAANSKTHESNIWILVDTQSLQLSVMKGDRPVEIFKNISIGRNGVGLSKRRGDDKTPLGTFKIAWVNRSSQYHLFFGLDYPSMIHVKKGLTAGLIDEGTYDRFEKSRSNGIIPPQNTPLGGQIGIHGVGRGNADIHQTMNWTNGCIALTNKQIEELDRWVKEGTLVVIL